MEQQQPKCKHTWHYWTVVYDKLRECYTCNEVQQLIDKIWVPLDKEQDK